MKVLSTWAELLLMVLQLLLLPPCCTHRQNHGHLLYGAAAAVASAALMAAAAEPLHLLRLLEHLHLHLRYLLPDPMHPQLQLLLLLPP